MGKAKAGLAEPSRSASPLELLVLRYKARQLKLCDDLLTHAGVPEWVMLTGNDGVPSNSTPCRLNWYLMRRKDVAPTEIDQELLKDMEENLRAAQAMQNDRGQAQTPDPEKGMKP